MLLGSIVTLASALDEVICARLKKIILQLPIESQYCAHRAPSGEPLVLTFEVPKLVKSFKNGIQNEETSWASIQIGKNILRRTK